MSVDVSAQPDVECPRTPPLSDRVEQIVRLRTASRIRNLRVEIVGNQVVLTGTAPTYYVKQLATHAALDEIERRTLTNDIEVS